MRVFPKMAWLPLGAALTIAVGTLAVYAGGAVAAPMELMLSGTHEVPPVETKASGQGTIAVNADHTVSGSISTKGIAATAAHIHEAAAGKNGPVIIPLEKKGNDTWVVPAGAKLTDAQYKAFEAGDLYVNVHSKAHPGGEIRAQLKP